MQVINDGQVRIVLGVDGQTIGGYPKVAYVISRPTSTGWGSCDPGRP